MRETCTSSLSGGRRAARQALFLQPDCNGPVSHCLLPQWRIAKERLRCDLTGVSVADSDGRDIVQAVNRDALVVRNGNVQRPNQFARVISVVHASFSLSDCAAHEHDHSRSKFWATPMLKREDSGGGTRGIAADAPVFGGRAA